MSTTRVLGYIEDLFIGSKHMVLGDLRSDWLEYPRHDFVEKLLVPCEFLYDN